MENLDESKKQTRRERDKKIYIDRATLFKGITLILNCFEGSGFEFKKYYGSKTRHLEHSGEWIGHSTITYRIERDGDIVLEEERRGYEMDKNNCVHCTDKQIIIDFTEVADLLDPLYVRYPYLKGIVDKMRIAILLEGLIDEFDMLNLAREYVLQGEGLIDVTEYLKSMQSHNAVEILNIIDRRIELKQKEESGQTC